MKAKIDGQQRQNDLHERLVSLLLELPQLVAGQWEIDLRVSSDDVSFHMHRKRALPLSIDGQGFADEDEGQDEDEQIDPPVSIGDIVDYRGKRCRVESIADMTTDSGRTRLVCQLLQLRKDGKPYKIKRTLRAAPDALTPIAE